MSESDSVLPPLYRGWVEPVLGPVRGEPRATCLDCAMTDRPGAPPLELAFDPRVKCCTYQPDVANYNVGRVLADGDPTGAEARRVLRRRIADRVGVTPFGVHVDPSYRTLFENASAAFGRSRVMGCPYYVDRDGGLCGIWQHRDSVCTTWFCKVDGGADGAIFWRIMRTLLGQLEMAVKRWLVRAAGLSEEAQADLWSRMEYQARGVRPAVDEHSLANTVDLGRYRKDWDNFFGREEEFFARCAELAEGLSSEDALRLGGMPLQASLGAARSAMERLASAELPDRVTTGAATYYQIRKRGELRLRHPDVKLDWIDLPESVAHGLHRFRQGPAREVLAQLQAEGVPIDEELVRRLLRWQALLEA